MNRPYLTPIVQTVLGDIPASELGICYPHEHLFGAPPAAHTAEDFELDSFDAAVQEVQTFFKAGGRALVDMSTQDYNRDVRQLRQVSKKTSVHIVAATGFNKDRFSKSMVDGLTDEQLDALHLKEVTQGIDGTDIRAGVLKAASSLNYISSTAKRVFSSIARIHLQTGIPISTHTEAGTMALEQVTLLTDTGVSPHHIIIGHLDRNLDWAYIHNVAQTGVYLGFDQISKEKYFPDALRIEFVIRLIDAGFGDQVLLSGDLARRSYWPAYGGRPGFTYILTQFVPMLRSAGVTDALINTLLVENPANALSISQSV